MLIFLSKHTQGPSGSDSRTNVPETQRSLGLEMQVCKCTIGNFYPQLARHRGDRTGHRVHYSATVPQMGSIQKRCKSTRMWNFSTHCIRIEEAVQNGHIGHQPSPQLRDCPGVHRCMSTNAPSRKHPPGSTQDRIQGPSS